MFNDNQIKILEHELDSKRIKTRTKGNINLSYLEGFDIIETANRIFGFGNWEYSISKLEMVSQEKNQNDNIVICYKAIIRTVVYDTSHSKQIIREDVGFGTGISKTLADANEGGAKEAVTDGLKRSLKSYGNQLGLSLYDKRRNHSQAQNNTPSSNTQQQYQNQKNQVQVSTQHMSNNNQSNQQSSFNQYEYSSLFNIGLNIVENNGFLIVTGDDIYSKKDSIKACSFRFDPKTKTWWKPIEQGAA